MNRLFDFGMWTALAIVVSAWCAPARAQSPPPAVAGAVADADRIADALARMAGPGRGALREDGAIDGEAGLFVLKREDIFFAFAGAEIGHSGNPLRSADDVGASALGQLSLGAGVRTRVADRWDAGASVTVSRTEYAEAFAPSGASVTANASLGAPVGRWPLHASVTGFVGWSLDADFASPTRFQGVAAQLAGRWRLGENFDVRPALGVTRIVGEIRENDATTVDVRVAISRPIGPVIATATASLSRTLFDDFYEDVTFVERGDWQRDVGLTIEWPLRERVSIVASIRHVSRDSDFFLASYDGLDGGLSIGARWRF